MKVADVRGIEFNCSIPVLFLLPLAAVFDELWNYLIMVLSIMIHETAHAFTAMRLGYRIISLDMQPFGCVAKLLYEPVSSADNAAIYAAGPLASILLCICGAALTTLLPTNKDLVDLFVKFNLNVAVLNLFPVLPLDGGRLACALLSKRYNARSVTLFLCNIGLFFGIVLIIIGIIKVVFTSQTNIYDGIQAAMLGFFIMLSSNMQRKDLSLKQIKQHLNAQSRLQAGAALPVRALAMNKDVTVQTALGQLRTECYGIVLITDEHSNHIGTICEYELMQAAMEGRSEQSIFSELMLLKINNRLPPHEYSRHR